jgi:cyanophycin synthetase
MRILLQLYAYAWRAKMLLSIQTQLAKRHRSEFYKDIWREAASELNATFQVIGNGSFKISRGKVSTIIRNNYTTIDDPVTSRVTLDKPLVHKKLHSHGLPTPNHDVFSLNEIDRGYRFLSLHKLCVVKPAAGTGAGKGITTGIETRSQLLKAAVRASGWASRLLVEEQVRGDNVRLLYLDGKLLDAVRRWPPSIVGDGKSSIGRLIKRLNKRRLDKSYRTAQVFLNIDLDMHRTLALQNLSWGSVPNHGQRVVLKTVINDNTREDNERVVDQISPSIVADAAQAVKVLRVRLAGVDILTSDLRQGLAYTSSVILEINSDPGYHYHYFTRSGACRVAVPILDACLKSAGSGETFSRRYFHSAL